MLPWQKSKTQLSLEIFPILSYRTNCKKKKLKLIKCDFEILTSTPSIPFLPLGCSSFRQPSAATGWTKVSSDAPAESTMLPNPLKLLQAIRLTPHSEELITELGPEALLGN